MNHKQIINIAAYRFVSLTEEERKDFRIQFKTKTVALDLKGTILLSLEGINLFMSGTRENIDAFIEYLNAFKQFEKMTYKESVSDDQPFSRMLVRLKKEIISMGHCEIKPEQKKAPYISPQELKKWYDEKRDMLVLDTRNDYEVALGTFDHAEDLNIETFRDFPNAIELLPEELKEKPIVTFCTGGIRCEKAAQYMLNKGFKNVYQLDGGILNYFEKVGADHYHGECFVFDKRVAVDPSLKETQTTQCYACRGVLTVKDQETPACPHCQHIAETRENGRRSPLA